VSQVPLSTCARCGAPLPTNALVCGRCGALVYADALRQLAAEAKWQAQYNPARAIALWEECLKRLPTQSGQYAAVLSEIAQLQSAPRVAIPEPGSLSTVRQESLPLAILKTGLSMLLSIVVYHFNFTWVGAIGFVLLILVHEIGHVVANLYYGIRASPPIFIPYLGAVINLRQNPPNAKVEAIIGIAGPVAGTIGSLAALALYLATGSQMALDLAWFGATMNLFNLLPVPPLDGGRVTAAISPWVWVIGLGGLGLMMLDDLRTHSGSGVLLLILVFALPRIIKTLKPAGRRGPYYTIGKTAPMMIGLAYLLLLALLVAMRWYTQQRLPGGGLF